MPWEKGQSGNPGGRPKGSRHKLCEDFLGALKDDFELHGVKALQTARTDDPVAYCAMIAKLLPKDVNLNLSASEAFVGLLERIDAGLASRVVGEPGQPEALRNGSIAGHA